MALKFKVLPTLVYPQNKPEETWLLQFSEQAIAELTFYASLVKRLGILEIKTNNIHYFGDHYEFHIGKKTFWIKIYAEYSDKVFTTGELELWRFEYIESYT